MLLVFPYFFLQNYLRRGLSFASLVDASNCSNMKVQNAFLAKFIIVNLKIDAFSIFTIFLKCSTKEFTNQLFL